MTNVRSRQDHGENPRHREERTGECLTPGEKKKHQNELLDEGLMETFPASDPISVIRVE